MSYDEIGGVGHEMAQVPALSAEASDGAEVTGTALDGSGDAHDTEMVREQLEVELAGARTDAASAQAELNKARDVAGDIPSERIDQHVARVLELNNAIGALRCEIASLEAEMYRLQTEADSRLALVGARTLGLQEAEARIAELQELLFRLGCL